MEALSNQHPGRRSPSSSSSTGEKEEVPIDYTPAMVEALIDEAVKVTKVEKPEEPPPDFTPEAVNRLLAEASDISKGGSKSAEHTIIGKLISCTQFYVGYNEMKSKEIPPDKLTKEHLETCYQFMNELDLVKKECDLVKKECHMMRKACAEIREEAEREKARTAENRFVCSDGTRIIRLEGRKNVYNSTGGSIERNI